MSDPFDKSAAKAAGSSSKQVATALVLAIAFIGVLVFQFRGQPRSAEANTARADDPNAPVVNSESATKAIALLADDPTAKLLRGGVEGPNPLDDVPNNPFVLSLKWRSKLTKAPPPRAIVPLGVPRVDNGPAFDSSHIQVSMIFKQGTGFVAVVNGRPTNVGAIVAGARIIEIRADRLICTQIAKPSAPPFEILMGRPR